MLDRVPQAEGIHLTRPEGELQEIRTGHVQTEPLPGMVGRFGGDVAAADAPAPSRQGKEKPIGTANLEYPLAARNPAAELPQAGSEVGLVSGSVMQVVEVLGPPKVVARIEAGC